MIPFHFRKKYIFLKICFSKFAGDYCVNVQYDIILKCFFFNLMSFLMSFYNEKTFYIENSDAFNSNAGSKERQCLKQRRNIEPVFGPISHICRIRIKV